VTAGTGREIEWITRQMGCVFPREWEQFIAPVPDVRYDGNIATAYAPKRS
jgi:proline iminopeptidase